MPRLRMFRLSLLLAPALLVGCQSPTLPEVEAALRLGERGAAGTDPLDKCRPPACRISFSFANAPAGQDGDSAPDRGWEDVKPNDTTPWILP